MNQREGEAAKYRALGFIEQAQGLLEQAAEAICSVRGLGPSWEEVSRIRYQVKDVWHQLEEAQAQADPDPRVPNNVAGFAQAAEAISTGETDSVLIHAVYEDWKQTNDGDAVGFQADLDCDPVDELNKAVDEARAYLRVADDQPMAIELD
tara:strand:+ start:6224 stop:6673 length:450 start_codon:yes stop_codon:yes gene_type:complete